MRGYFGIGVESISKPGNLGNLLRSAHAFGAAFAFTIAPAFPARDVGRADTSDSSGHVPLYTFQKAEDILLPRGCKLVGIELLDEAVDLPTFHHPQRAAYVLGPERGVLSQPLIERCDAVIKIPTRFCVNVATAGAIVMYDRVISLGRFGRRALSVNDRPEPRPDHVHGGPVIRGGELVRR